jgi:hypothetical protein
MRRHELMLLLAGAMTSAPALRAQQRAMPMIGSLTLRLTRSAAKAGS